jgi:hypothetical protein
MCECELRARIERLEDAVLELNPGLNWYPKVDEVEKLREGMIAIRRAADELPESNLRDAILKWSSK